MNAAAEVINLAEDCDSSCETMRAPMDAPMVPQLSRPKPSPDLSGLTLAHFRVDERIKAGSMGVVYRGLDLSLLRPVALKILRPDLAAVPETADRFLAEARLLATVRHQNVVDIHYAGYDQEHYFLAMEWVTGPDLQILTRDRGPIPLADAYKYICHAARGLYAVSRVGLVHRDVKPSNLVLDDAGAIRVTDFGMALPLADQVLPEDDESEYVCGSPAYMAPEQFIGDTLDHRTDFYGLGCTFYHLLVGRPPFAGGNDMVRLARAHMHEPIPVVEGVPPVVNEVLRRMTSKTRHSRHKDHCELFADLDKLRPYS